MARALRAGAGALLLLLLGSCAIPPLPLDLVVRDGKLLFWSARNWTWLLTPERHTLAVDRIEVWHGTKWLWRIRAPEGAMIRLPIGYGEYATNAEVLVAPRQLQPGVTYRVDVGTLARINAFRLDGKGGLWTGTLAYAPDPDLARDLAIDAEYRRSLPERERKRIGELVATGMSERQAQQAVLDERSRGVPY